MRASVRLFAVARDKAGGEVLEVALPEGQRHVAGLREALARACPALADLLPGCRIARNQEFAADGDPIQPGDELAVIPPVSGGAPAGIPSRVGPEPLDAERLAAAVGGPDAGCILTFIGTVREENQGRQVLRLEYEGYAPMAEKVLDTIAEETARRWPGVRVAVHHRTGMLELGEASVVIAVASPHREPAFLACRHVIEELKRRVPIWKREHTSGGAVWIETEADRR